METVLLSLLIMALCVYLLAVVTENYFLESLEVISEKLKLSPSVAGASLMAMGSSAPELAIALIALFRGGGEHSDLGIGTIVGSAVFNVLVITGASALVRTAMIDMKVIVRDAVMYLASIALLVWAFLDGKIAIYEASLFLVLYALYIAVLLFWKTDDAAAFYEAPIEKESSGLFALVPKLIGFVAGNPRANYIRSFVLSIVFIGALCHVLVDAAVNFSNALSLPPVLVGLTLLAAATSVPA